MYFKMIRKNIHIHINFFISSADKINNQKVNIFFNISTAKDSVMISMMDLGNCNAIFIYESKK